MSQNYCPNCGAGLQFKEAEICPSCGVRIKGVSGVELASGYRETKSPGLAAVMSFFIPGLGQIYNGQIGKGIAMVIASVIFAIMMIILIGIPLYIILWLYAIYDAYDTATKMDSSSVV